MFLLKLFSISLLLSSSAGAWWAEPTSICGGEDTRLASFNSAVGRIYNQNEIVPNYCSFTMVGRTCAITAGHCVDSLQQMEFNIPYDLFGSLAADHEDVYFVAPGSVVSESEGVGRDWAVFQLQKNQQTGLWPGDAQGYYEVYWVNPLVGDALELYGYGRSSKPYISFSQQKSEGLLTQIKGASLSYHLDTTGGNSGAALIHTESQSVIGVHAHGGCGVLQNSANMGTFLLQNQTFLQAVISCLESELYLAE